MIDGIEERTFNNGEMLTQPFKRSQEAENEVKEHLQEHIDAFIKAGGTIMKCPSCTYAKPFRPKISGRGFGQ